MTARRDGSRPRGTCAICGQREEHLSFHKVGEHLVIAACPTCVSTAERRLAVAESMAPARAAAAAARMADTEETDMPKPTAKRSSSGRRSPGALREQVLEFLQRRGQKAEGYSPATISKALDASSGAIGNALEKMTDEGITRRVSDKPKRYAVVAKSDRRAS